MSFDFMKKSIEELKQELVNKKLNGGGIVGQWQDYPTNWEEMQDADQPELTEMEEVRLLQIKQDNQEPIEDYVYMGMSREDEPPR